VLFFFLPLGLLLSGGELRFELNTLWKICLLFVFALGVQKVCKLMDPSFLLF